MRPLRGLRRPQFYASFLILSILVASLTIWQFSMLLLPSWDHDQSSLETVLSPRKPSSFAPPTISVASKRLARISDDRPRAVFYNIFVPDGEYRDHALKIVEEQMALKQKSASLKTAPLYYTLIGTNATAEVESICRAFHNDDSSPNLCHQLRYVPEGDEGLTLQSVHDYCQNNQGMQITYLHNKGSYHPSDRNEKFRAFLNRGIFDDDCSEMPLDQCNVCAARFSTFPHYHMAGNMWTATCDYIRLLIAPSEFPNRMEKLLEWTLTVKDPSIPKPTFKQYTDGYPVGRDRYAYEHWLCSHPHLKPCDVYARKYTHGYRDLPSLTNYWKPKLASAPRFDIHTFLKISALRGAWYCGQARLLEYAYLYNGLQPPSDHFVWDYYLDSYKGCDTPLNRTIHQDMFTGKLSTNGD
jgi:hypothetical protein